MWRHSTKSSDIISNSAKACCFQRSHEADMDGFWCCFGIMWMKQGLQIWLIGSKPSDMLRKNQHISSLRVMPQCLVKSRAGKLLHTPTGSAGSLSFPGNMEVSWNRGTPKSSIFIGFSLINQPFWGTPNLGNSHTDTRLKNRSFPWISTPHLDLHLPPIAGFGGRAARTVGPWIQQNCGSKLLPL